MMAFATHLTLVTEHELSLGEGGERRTNKERQRISVSITYALEAGDTDVPLLATIKASDLAQAHRAAAEVLRAYAFPPPPLPANLNPKPANPQPANPHTSLGERASSEEARLEEDDPLRPEPRDEDDPNEDDPNEDVFNESESGDEEAGDEEAEEYSDEDSADQDSSPSREQPNQEPSVQKPSLGQAISGAIGSSAAASGSQAFGSRAYPNGVGEVPSGPRITQPQKIAIQSLARQIGLASYELNSVLYQQFGTWSLERLSKDQAHDLHVALQQGLKDKKEKVRLEKQTGNAQPEAAGAAAPSDNRAPSRNGHTVVAAG